MKKLIALSCLGFLPSTWSIPTHFSNHCAYSDFSNFTNSEVLIDHQNCQTMYVKPPLSGEVKFSSFTENANLGFCDSVRGVFQIVKKLDQARNRLIGAIDEQEEEVQRILKEKEEVEKELIDYANSFYPKEAKRIERKLEDLNLSIEQYIENYEKCEHNCSYINDEIKELKKSRIVLKKERAELRKDHRKEALLYERMQAQKEALENAMTAVYERLDRRQGLLSSLSKQVEDQYRFYAKLEGGIVNLSYQSLWDQNIKDLNKKYKGSYQFKPIMTKNAQIHLGIGAADKSSYYNSLPILLDYNVNGIKAINFGEKQETSQSSLASKLSGTARLSLMGACPLKYKNFLENEELEENDSFHTGPTFGVALTYDYPSNFKFNVSAEYNLYKFFERIESSVSRGGFFSRGVYHSIVENRIDEDAFDIDWEIEDPDLNISWDQRLKIRKVLKEDLTQRVLSMTATPVAPKMMGTKGSVSMPSQNEADSIADGLEDLCWGSSVWCRGGVFVLRGLSSIFSRSEARSHFKSTWDRTARESWSENIASWKSGATAYTFEGGEK